VNRERTFPLAALVTLGILGLLFTVTVVGYGRLL
jgi:hypothetical protein